MKIETKFDIGDNVFLLVENKVNTAEVITAHVRISRNTYNVDIVEIHYVVTDISRIISEKDLFATKQELLDSL